MSLASRLGNSFSNTIKSRGNGYIRRVRIKEGTESVVKALVHGSHSYAVTLVRDEDAVHVECNCPYFDSSGPCKHLWAVILEAELFTHSNCLSVKVGHILRASRLEKIIRQYSQSVFTAPRGHGDVDNSQSDARPERFEEVA